MRAMSALRFRSSHARAAAPAGALEVVVLVYLVAALDDPALGVLGVFVE